MANDGNSTVDANKLIVEMSPAVLSAIAAYRQSFESAAAAAGVSADSIAGAIAREMNKVDAGDYNIVGVGSISLGTLFTALKNSIAIYGPAAYGGAETSLTPLTQQDYVDNLSERSPHER